MFYIRIMKLGIFFLLTLWLLFTTLFVFSIIGWIMIVKVNETNYHKYGAEMRTVWMQFGYDLKEAFLKKD